MKIIKKPTEEQILTRIEELKKEIIAGNFKKATITTLDIAIMVRERK